MVLFAFFSVNAWSMWDNRAVYNTATSQLQASSIAGALLAPVTHAIGEIHRGHLLGLHAIVDAIVIAMLLFRARH